VLRASRLKRIRPLHRRKLRFLELVDKHPEQTVHHRQIDAIAASAALTREQRGLNRAECVRPAQHIAHVDAGVEWSLEAVLVREIDEVEAACRVKHWRVSAARRPRTAL